MRVPLHDIRDPNVRAFLRLLRRCGICDIVVLGGAVRDILLGRPCRDIDVAVRVQVEPPTAVREPNSDGAYRMVPALERGLRSLSVALGYDVSCFQDRVPFGETAIDVLGLLPVRDAHGREFPDVFVDCNQQVFNARPELSVSQLVLDSNGRVWPTSGVQDLVDRVGRITDAPLPIHLRQIVRALRTCEEIDLTLTSDSVEKMIRHLRELQEPARFHKEIGEEDAPQLVDALLGRRPEEERALDRDWVLNGIASLVRGRSRQE